MENNVSLEQAVAALRKMYGPEYGAGFEGGKEDMAKTLQEQLGINAGQAKAAIEALVEAHTIAWQSQPDGLPNQEGTMGMVIDQAKWDLGE